MAAQANLYGVVTTGGTKISLAFSQTDSQTAINNFLSIFSKAVMGDAPSLQQLGNILLYDNSNTYSQTLLMSAYTTAMQLGLNIPGSDSTPFFQRINAWGRNVSTEDYMNAALFGSLVQQWLNSYPSTFQAIVASPDKTDYNLLNGSFDVPLIPQYGNMDPTAGVLYNYLLGISQGISSADHAMVTASKSKVAANISREPLITKHDPLGGIDLNAANLNLQIKRDGRGVPLPLAQQDMTQLNNLEGLEPVILKIQPAIESSFLTQILTTQSK